MQIKSYTIDNHTRFGFEFHGNNAKRQQQLYFWSAATTQKPELLAVWRDNRWKKLPIARLPKTARNRLIKRWKGAATHA